MSDTALESLDIILFSTIIFGYHNVTHGTQKYTYVKHTKLNRLERGHFELFGIRQQVLTKSIIMKMSASQSSFRKCFTSKQYVIRNDILAKYTLLKLTLYKKVMS